MIAGCAHHVTQRGNDGQTVFVEDEDREVFLALLREASRRFAVAVEGYCLMSNHVHVIARPQTEEALGMAMKRTNQLYAQYVNRRYDHRGHLWQDRFFSCPLGEAHFWKALAYVERNPVRARLCRKPWRWIWSSAAAHCGGQDASGLLDLVAWNGQIDTAWWKDRLGQPEDEKERRLFQLCTHRGRPFADTAFLDRWEKRLGFRLRPRIPGRPKKAKTKSKKTRVRP